MLAELNRLINNGEQALQCYNSVGNRNDSWFTQLLFVSRTIGNLLYHQAKYKLGLSAYLMGNGLCFTSRLLKKEGWTAFTVGEDWEYYARLIEKRIKIGFAAGAKVFHQESQELESGNQPTSQMVERPVPCSEETGDSIVSERLRNRDWFTLDASLPLILPNYSLQINLTFLALGLCFFLPATPFKSVLALDWGHAHIRATFIICRGCVFGRISTGNFESRGTRTTVSGLENGNRHFDYHRDVQRGKVDTHRAPRFSPENRS